jgi:alpha-tubulin suppressor-like RCC1 family protein
MSGILQALLASFSAAAAQFQIYGWGNNSEGRVGDRTTINRSSPVQVGEVSDWSDLSAGDAAAGAIKSDGSLWMWGSGSNGSLGIGNDDDRSSPVQVGALTNWYRVYAGYATFATKTDGTLWAWGKDEFGMLGLNTYGVNKSSPVQVGSFTNWVKATSGFAHSVGINSSGEIYSWGRNNYGQLGQNTSTSYTSNKSSPVQIGAETNWADISTGGNSVGALKTDGTIWSWGRNNFGQLGDETTANRSSPVQIGASTDWAKLVIASSGGALP